MRVIRAASLRPLLNKRIAVLGYGAQGRAQALNLRDAGFVPLVGLPPRSRSREIVSGDGLEVTVPGKAVAAADIVFILAPDHLHGDLYRRSVHPNLKSKRMLVFAHASSVHFGTVHPPADVDVILVAPLGPGRRLRELRGARDGVACFLAIHQNPSRRARSTGLALARAIGCLPAGVIETTFAAEAVGDLFGEQAVLCGGLGALLSAGVETLVAHGHAPHTAYLECVHQLDLIVDLIKSEGLEGMYRQISPTAAYGARVAGPKVIAPATRRAMAGLFRQIESGRFFAGWIKTARGRSRKERLPNIPAAYRRGEREVLQAMGKKGH